MIAPAPALRRRAVVALLIALYVGGVAWLGARRGAGSFDDPFITYTYAASLARGEGLTWNGETVLGTSTPFLAVLLGALEWALPLGVPVWGAIVYWTAVAVAGLVLFVLGRREGWAAAGMFAAVALPLALFVHSNVGSEMLPAVAAVLVAAWLLARDRFGLAGLALAVAVALRAEVAVAGLCLGVAELWRARRENRGPLPAFLRVAGAFAGAIALWAAALYALTGAVVPETLGAKRAQAGSTLGAWSSGDDVFALASESLPSSLWLRTGAGAIGWAIALLLLGVLGLAASRTLAAPLRLALLAWGPLQLVLVAALGVAYYPWYAVPFFFSAALLVAQSAELIPRYRFQEWARIAAGAAAAVVVAAFVPSYRGWQLSPGTEDPRRVAYDRVGALLASYPPETRLAAYEVGFLGFSSRRPVQDLLGLVSPGVDLANVKSGDLRSNLDRLDPDLVMLPLAGGSLFGRTVGDVDSFVERFRLERLQLGLPTGVVVYRRASVPGSGEVLLDLIPALDAAGADIAVREVRLSAVTARWAGGSELGVRLPAALPFSRFVAGYVPGEPGARRIRFSIVDANGTLVRKSSRALDSADWRVWTEDLPALPEGGELWLRCEGHANETCDLGFPHLAAIRN